MTSVSSSSSSSSASRASSSSSTSSTSSSTRSTSPRSTQSVQTTQVGHSGASSFGGATSSRTTTTSSRTQTKTQTNSLRAGANNAQVRALQDKLRSAGFNPGRSDGIFGPNTERAVRDFQQARGLKVDGIAGRNTFSALNGPQGTTPHSPAPHAGVNGTARLNTQPAGPGMTTGALTVNGHTYQFNSGGRSRFSTPQGEYRVTAHRNSRSDAGFVRDGVGFSFRLEDVRRPNSDAMYDARAERDRTALRIHPDGGAVGTSGCIGIVGDAATLRQFRDDMNAELRRNGGSYTLRVQ